MIHAVSPNSPSCYESDRAGGWHISNPLNLVGGMGSRLNGLPASASSRMLCPALRLKETLCTNHLPFFPLLVMLPFVCKSSFLINLFVIPALSFDLIVVSTLACDVGFETVVAFSSSLGPEQSPAPLPHHPSVPERALGV